MGAIMTDCLTFTNLTDAQNACDQMWYNKIMATANNDYEVIGDCINHYYLSDLQGMAKEQIVPLKIYSHGQYEQMDDEGNVNGVLETIVDYTKGLTERYSTPLECVNEAGKYWILKDNTLMANVVNYADETYDPDWASAEDD